MSYLSSLRALVQHPRPLRRGHAVILLVHGEERHRHLPEAALQQLHHADQQGSESVATVAGDGGRWRRRRGQGGGSGQWRRDSGSEEAHQSLSRRGAAVHGSGEEGYRGEKLFASPVREVCDTLARIRFLVVSEILR